jgi:hypothetical protein
VKKLGATLVAMCALLATFSVAHAAPRQGPEPGSTASIEIVQTPSGGSSPFCLPPVFAMRQSVREDATTFRLTVRVTTTLCSRINAVAAIYKMPGNGVAWPQELADTAPFSLKEPGITEVIFTKGCEPVQFDVIVGATPPVISPLGPWHGPLLFPFDLSTSLQWWGCGPPPTTTTSTTTTSSTTTTIADDCDDYTPGNVTVDPSSVAPGGSVTVSGTGTPGTLIEVLLQPPDSGTADPALSAAERTAGFVAMSDPALVQPDGTWQATLFVPQDAPAGNWVVTARAVGCETVVSTELIVTGGGTVDSSTTEPPVVAGESIVNTLPPEALGATAVAGTGTSRTSGLAFTGSSTHVVVALGIALLTAGGLVLLGSRRRRTA